MIIIYVNMFKKRKKTIESLNLIKQENKEHRTDKTQ